MKPFYHTDAEVMIKCQSGRLPLVYNCLPQDSYTDLSKENFIIIHIIILHNIGIQQSMKHFYSHDAGDALIHVSASIINQVRAGIYWDSMMYSKPQELQVSH